MKNFFIERRVIFFAGGGPECAGDDGVCLPEDVQPSPEVAKADIDARVDKAMEKIEKSIRTVGDKFDLKTRVLSDSDGNMKFYLDDSFGRTCFCIEMDGDTCY